MTRSCGRLVAVLMATVFVVSAGTTAAFAASEEEVELARQERDRAAAEKAAALTDLDQAVTAFHTVTDELERLTVRMERLREQIASYDARSRVLVEAVQVRAVEAYMTSGVDADLARLTTPEMVQESLLAREVLAMTTRADTSSIDSLTAVTAEMGRLRAEIDAHATLAADLQVEQAAVVARMNELFESASVVAADTQAAFTEVNAAFQERLRREEEERRIRDQIRAALGAPGEGVPMWVTPGFICPIAGPNWFIDTWHAPRPGGRVHKGTDMFAARGTPLVAVGDGTVRKSFDTLGGAIVWLYADHGVNYFYAHLDGYPAGLTTGQRVGRGQVIGYVGDTGNPAPGAYHLHFGIYPGGIMAVNPYSTVLSTCS